MFRGLDVRWVTPHGYPVRIEDMDYERLDGWQRCYDGLKAAGWDVR